MSCAYVALCGCGSEPEPPPPGSEESDRASELEEKQDVEGAVKAYSEAIEINPKLAGARFSRGRLHVGAGRFDEAIADMNAVLKLDPKMSAAKTVLGEAYFKKGDHETAIRYLSEVVAVNPYNPRAFYLRGLSYQALDRFDESEADLRKARKLNPRIERQFQ